MYVSQLFVARTQATPMTRSECGTGSALTCLSS